MFSNQIPSALQIFNNETIERKNNVRQFLGLKKVNNRSFSGLYGVDFCLEQLPANKTNYIPCLEHGCSFRGPASMMDFHVDTVHKTGLDSRFDVETETWRQNRKKNFPKAFVNKSVVALETTEKTEPKMTVTRYNNVGKEKQNNRENEKRNTNLFDNDLLGLGAVYGSSDEDPEAVPESEPLTMTTKISINSDPQDNNNNRDNSDGKYPFLGLPCPDQLDPKALLPRKNRYRFPILPEMDVQSKRRAMMNPGRKYQDNFNRKVKRPRLADLLLAEEMARERTMVLQCIRYLVNQRFFDMSFVVDGSAESVVGPKTDGDRGKEESDREEGEIIDDDQEEMMVEDQEENGNQAVWSDDEFF